MHSDVIPERARPPRNRAALASFALALGVSIGLLVAPTSTTETGCFPAVSGHIEGASPLPVEPCHPGVSHRSLLQDQGWGVVIPLSVPVLIAAIALGLQRTRARRVAAFMAGCLLFGFVVLGAFSIGIFYLPATIAMFVAGKPEREVLVAT